MINNKKRPINLDLTTIKFPIMAIVSILHRISGVVLFLFLPIILYIFNLSSINVKSFVKVQDWLSYPANKLIIWLFVSALSYHLFAGIRHMLMDLGYGDSLNSGKCGAAILIAITILSTFLLGIWIW